MRWERASEENNVVTRERATQVQEGTAKELCRDCTAWYNLVAFWKPGCTYVLTQNACALYCRVQDAPCNGCKPDSEGSWAIGMLRGPSPLHLLPIEASSAPINTHVSWPVANPVVTCACQPEASNFVADPFLFQHVDGKLYML